MKGLCSHVNIVFNWRATDVPVVVKPLSRSYAVIQALAWREPFIHAKVLICTSHNVTLCVALLATIAWGISRPSWYLKGFVASAAFALMLYTWTWQVTSVNEDRSRQDRVKMAPSCFSAFGFKSVMCSMSLFSLITQNGGSGIWNYVALRSLWFTCADYVRHAPGMLNHDSLLWGKQTLGLWSTIP